MRYMMMVYDQERDWSSITPEEAQASIDAFVAFHTEMAKRGIMQFAERLQSSQTATGVRVRDGKALATDGPFAESKEQMGGIYIFDCENLDEAIAIAAKIPSAQSGMIEIRPIFEPDPDMIAAHEEALQA
jgi:hypothetical protein